ncbi:response regulator transcription factor [Alteromonas pelagimontana]|nr:response regulator [Alteromonas pelagimontana]
MKRILLIDDDERFAQVLRRRFEATGNYTVETFPSASAAMQAVKTTTHAILLDMMLEQEIGLDFVVPLNARFSPKHLIIMTGYASIATTVAAMKKGATNYIAKPVGFAVLLQQLSDVSDQEEVETFTHSPMTAAQVEWEHIQRVLLENNGNVSAAAKALKMHRRSLQRKLQKFSPNKI